MTRPTPSALSADSVLASPGRNLISILVFMAVVVTLSTLAYMQAGWSLIDASYMVTLTVFTVGFDEVRPIDTAYLHAVTMGTIVMGCTGMILLTSALVQLSTGVQLRQLLGSNRMQDQIDKLTEHVIICGFGRIGLMLARDLADGGMPLVILDQSAERLREAEAAGHLCLAGDATADEVLLAAGIARARVLATVLPNDAANVFITLSARNLNPSVEIIARGEAPTTETKLRHAGANQVVLPTHIGAEKIARLIFHPESAALTDDARVVEVAHQLDHFGLRMELVTAIEGATLTGLSVAEAERAAAGSFFIVQIDRGAAGRVPRPQSSELIRAGDRVMIVARDGGGRARHLFATRAKVRVRRKIF